MPYIVLNNKTASIFADISQGISVTSHTVPVHFPKITKRMVEAIKGGAIREVEDDKAEEMINSSLASTSKGTTKGGKGGKGGKDKGDSLEEKLLKMTPEERLTYYTENFDVEEADKKAFLAMKPEEQVGFLID